MRSLVILLAIVPVMFFSHPLDFLLPIRGEPEYETIISTSTYLGEVFVLKSMGMNWQGIEWFHRIGVVIPKNLKYKDRAFVLVVGGSRYTENVQYYLDTLKDIETYAWIVQYFKSPFIIIADVPNQPIWGLKEDGLIAETFEKFLENPEPTLPLLVPMVYGVIRALDSVQDFLKDKKLDIKYFMLSGASKRGWTTYLTAIFDPRIFAIAPMVYDNLKIEAQLSQQLEYYGHYSEKIKPYTARGLPSELKSNPNAEELLNIVDPYRLRLRLSVPKIIVLGTNDRYWTVDSINLYLDSLPGDTWVYYSPNDGHSITKVKTLVQTISAFFKLYPEGEFPKPVFEKSETEICVRDPRLKRLELWMARSKTMDFRNSLWIKKIGKNGGEGWCVNVPRKTDTENIAYFTRAVYELGGLEYYLSSRMFVLK